MSPVRARSPALFLMAAVFRRNAGFLLCYTQGHFPGESGQIAASMTRGHGISMRRIAVRDRSYRFLGNAGGQVSVPALRPDVVFGGGCRLRRHNRSNPTAHLEASSLVFSAAARRMVYS